MTTPPPPVNGAVVQPLPGENERGVPSVNAPRAATRWTRALLYGGLVMGLPALGAAWYFQATAPAPDPTAQQKSMPLTPSVPAKTFTLPAPVAPAPSLPVAAPTPTPAPAASPINPALAPTPPAVTAPPRPTSQTPPPRPPPVLDKSDSAMMVEGASSPPLGVATVRADGTPAAGQETALGGLLTATATPPCSASLLQARDYLCCPRARSSTAYSKPSSTARCPA